jgi:hypothetical protein
MYVQLDKGLYGLIDESSPPLSKSEAKVFHTHVMKALYAAKRGRPDLLTACSFLTTRPNCATRQDMDKLGRMLRYINSTRTLSLTLSADDFSFALCYTDSSFGVHPEMRSHSGSCITIGRGFFYCKSSKQKLNTKSSTEAELVAASDHYSQVIWCSEFFRAQGYSVQTPVLAQDNMSTIALINKGRSTADATRHINIRFFFIKDRVDSGEIKIVYVPTKDMVADYLTKPLQGELFRRLRDFLMGATKSPIYDQVKDDSSK